MPKETKKTTTKAAAPKKSAVKNPLLDADEDTVDETVDETETDEVEEDEIVDEEAEDETPAPTKPAPAPIETMKLNADQGLAADSRSIAKILEAEEKVPFMIPLSEGEKRGAIHEAWINGYKVTIKKGVMVYVPLSVASLLENSFNITADAIENGTIDQDDRKLDALA